jgi:hypothetical protein
MGLSMALLMILEAAETADKAEEGDRKNEISCEQSTIKIARRCDSPSPVQEGRYEQVVGQVRAGASISKAQ